MMSETNIITKKVRILSPKLLPNEAERVKAFGKKIKLFCPNQNAKGESACNFTAEYYENRPMNCPKCNRRLMTAEAIEAARGKVLPSDMGSGSGTDTKEAKERKAK